LPLQPAGISQLRDRFSRCVRARQDFDTSAAGSQLPLAASLSNGGFGAIAKLCKARFLRIADLDAWSTWAAMPLTVEFPLPFN
jgi:hypothetical protein